MDWRQYLRDERARLRENIQSLSSGLFSIHIISDGEQRDVTAERLKEAQGHLQEVEEIIKAERL